MKTNRIKLTIDTREITHELTIAEFKEGYGDAGHVVKLMDYGEDHLSPNQIKVGDIVELPNSVSGAMERFEIVD